MCGDYGRLCQSKWLLSDFLAISKDSVIACGRFLFLFFIIYPQHTENTIFSPILLLMDFMVGAFYRLFLWAFKKENINRFLWHSLSNKEPIK